MAVEAGPDTLIPVVAVDQHAGAALATRHLLDLGHTTVWHLAGPSEFVEARQRLDGWRRTLRRSLRSIRRPRWRGIGAPARPSSAKAAAERRPGSTGNTSRPTIRWPSAWSALCTRHGWDIPGDVSIVGFDDIPEAALLHAAAHDGSPDFDELGLAASDCCSRRWRPASGSRPDRPNSPRSWGIVRSSTTSP